MIKEEDLSLAFQNTLDHSPKFWQSVNFLRGITEGELWIIGGFIYRNIIRQVYGAPNPPQNMDLDFIVENLTDHPSLPRGVTCSLNSYGNPKYSYQETTIDVIPLDNVYSIKRRKVSATIEEALVGTPLGIQSIGYSILGGNLLGTIGQQAILEGVVRVNDPVQAEIYSHHKRKSLKDLIQDKAAELNFKAEFPHA